MLGSVYISGGGRVKGRKKGCGQELARELLDFAVSQITGTGRLISFLAIPVRVKEAGCPRQDEPARTG